MIQPLSVAQFNELQDDCFLIDSRVPELFAEGFVPGSVNIGLDGDLKKWAALLLPRHAKYLLITEPGQEQETASQLKDAGLKEIAGFLQYGFDAWKKSGEEVDMIITVDPDELIMDIPFDSQLQVVDVRSAIEFGDAHLKDALNLPLEEMVDIAELANFEENQNLYIHSTHNYRSTIAASLLKKHGYHNLRQVAGGWEKLTAEEKAEIVKGK